MTYKTIIKWTFHSLFLLILLQARGQEKVNVVTAEKELRGMNPDTLRVNRLLELSEALRTSDPKTDTNTNKAIAYVREALAISQKLKFQKGIGTAYLFYSRMEQDRHDYKKTLYFAQKAIGFFSAIKEYDLLGEAQVMQWSASTLSQHPVEERILLLSKAASSFEKAGNKSRQGELHERDGRPVSI
ncbi:MAG: hypothetical protein QM710_14795 [Flavobacterium sp.]